MHTFLFVVNASQIRTLGAAKINTSLGLIRDMPKTNGCNKYSLYKAQVDKERHHYMGTAEHLDELLKMRICDRHSTLVCPLTCRTFTRS